MIIINADDWGRSRNETDAALFFFRRGRITSASAMVFMEDSDRAAELALNAGMDIGLHLNLSQRFTGGGCTLLMQAYHARIVRFLTINKYSLLLYNPFLCNEFRYVYQAQVDEFHRLYGKTPSHIDGHHHNHLCTNMIADAVIPENEKIRRSFTYFAKEKNPLNRTYRRLVDRWIARRYRLTDYFFALSELLNADRMMRVAELAKKATVELMVHPARAVEHDCLTSAEYDAMLSGVECGTYTSMM